MKQLLFLLFLSGLYAPSVSCMHAYESYKQYLTLPMKDPELLFYVHYTLGTIAEELSQTHSSISWAQALGHYLDAYGQRPSRIEPLIAIALHYYQEQKMHACYLFAHLTADTPFPADDRYGVDEYAYSVLRYDLLSACAPVVGQLEIGEWAVHMALRVSPDDPHFLQKLAEYKRLKK